MALDDKHEAESRVFKVVGTRPIRPDGIDKVTGAATIALKRAKG